MTDKMRIWKALEKTNPEHTKPFTRAGGFKGTATKPIWQIMRLTEQFGPAGIGWGMEQPSFETVIAGDEILVFCTVALWYKDGEASGTVYGVGGDKVLGKNRNGPFTNDEAFKSSYTDALSNAMKQIGVGADIHMGLFDDNKYVQQTAREFEAQSMSQSPDVVEGSERWVREQQNILVNHKTKEEIDAWIKTHEKNIKKLAKDNEPLFLKLKQSKDDALDRVRAPV